MLLTWNEFLRIARGKKYRLVRYDIDLYFKARAVYMIENDQTEYKIY